MIATKKRVVLITLFVMLALLLAACGGASATELPAELSSLKTSRTRSSPFEASDRS